MARRAYTAVILCLILAADVFLAAADGEECKYFSKGKRDPFVPLTTGAARANMGIESVELVDDIRFDGIVFDPDGRSMVVLNGEVLKEGDKAGNVEVERIDAKSVTIKIRDKAYTINLIEEGGGKI